MWTQLTVRQKQRQLMRGCRETGKGGREKQHNIIYMYIHGLLTVRHLRLLFIEWQSVQGIYIVSYHIHAYIYIIEPPTRVK